MRLFPPFIGRCWSVVASALLVLYSIAASRAHGLPMQQASKVFLMVAAALQFATIFTPWLQVGLVAAVRVAFESSSLLFRSLALIVVGTPTSDRMGEFIGAGTALCFACSIVLMRLMFEMAMAGRRHGVSA